MKKTYLLKTLLLLTLALLQTIPAYASVGAAVPSGKGIIGSIDLFNSTHIHGWALDTANTGSAPELLIRITDTSTGETVKEVPASPDMPRSDLTALFGENTSPGFTVPIDLSDLKDGVYSAAGYSGGQQITGSSYYLKGNAEAGEITGARSLGNYRLTAYCPCRSCSAGWGRQTYSGTLATERHTVAVDRRVIPMGSRLMINGTIYTAEDVGGGVNGKHVDIFFESHEQARQFGLQTAEVFLIP